MKRILRLTLQLTLIVGGGVCAGILLWQCVGGHAAQGRKLPAQREGMGHLHHGSEASPLQTSQIMRRA